MASVRFRCLNPMRILRRQGEQVELYDAGRADRYAAVVVQGLSCLDQPLGGWATGDAFLREVESLKARGVKILVDDCDNHFYNPRNMPEWLDATTRLRRLLRTADHLIASTESVAELYRTEAGVQQPITVIGDGVESDRSLQADGWLRNALSWRRHQARFRAHAFARSLAQRRFGGELACVWFGSHGSKYADGGMLDLLRVKEVLETIGAEVPLSLTVISNSRGKFETSIAPFGIPTRYVEWDRIGFAATMQAHDVAIIPVQPTPFTLCKTNNRLVTALDFGLAVAADAIPSYEPFRDVCMLDNWHDGLLQYATQPALRQSHVAAGRKMISEQWTEAHVAARWGRLFSSYLPENREP